MSSDEDSGLSRQCSEIVPFVIDNGSDTCKAGFSGDDKPRQTFPSVIGRPRLAAGSKVSEGSKAYDPYVGDDAESKRGILNMCYPVEKGIIVNWDDMEKIWNHTFYGELRRPPEEQGIMLTEAPNNPKENREKITEIMFEQFQFPYMYLALQQVLSLYSSGRVTGVVVDLGYEVTRIVPIHDGYAYPHCLGVTQPVGGRHVTDYLMDILKEQDEAFSDLTRISTRMIGRDVKTQLCHVALDFEEETQNFTNNAEKSYELPDGRIVTIGNQMFRSPEILFQPSLIDVDCHGIHESIFDCVSGKIDYKERSVLYSNIVLSGGTSMFSGLRERVDKDVTQLIMTKKTTPTTTTVKVVAPPERLYSTWIGGSILSSLSTFEDMWITKREYEESGASIVHKKCPLY